MAMPQLRMVSRQDKGSAPVVAMEEHLARGEAYKTELEEAHNAAVAAAEQETAKTQKFLAKYNHLRGDIKMALFIKRDSESKSWNLASKEGLEKADKALRAIEADCKGEFAGVQDQPIRLRRALSPGRQAPRAARVPRVAVGAAEGQKAAPARRGQSRRQRRQGLGQLGEGRGVGRSHRLEDASKRDRGHYRPAAQRTRSVPRRLREALPAAGVGPVRTRQRAQLVKLEDRAADRGPHPSLPLRLGVGRRSRASEWSARIAPRRRPAAGSPHARAAS